MGKQRAGVLGGSRWDFQRLGRSGGPQMRENTSGEGGVHLNNRLAPGIHLSIMRDWYTDVYSRAEFVPFFFL